MSIHGVLGEQISYPKTYAPSLLYPIARKIGRDEIMAAVGFAGDYQGVDIWQAFEVSWLNPQGISQVATARFTIAANSPYIVESKSLKLYLNSLNFSKFVDIKDVAQTISKDLSACVGCDVQVALFLLSDDILTIKSPVGECIDDVLNDSDTFVSLTDDIDSSLLKVKSTNDVQTHQLYSNLLRSNCPVTNQPDWGTVQIFITTKYQLDKADLLAYILSFRQHNGFHEQCVERIFADLMTVYQPSCLRVVANYTRRGGIDINPIRVFCHDDLTLDRLIRQ